MLLHKVAATVGSQLPLLLTRQALLTNHRGNCSVKHYFGATALLWNGGMLELFSTIRGFR